MKKQFKNSVKSRSFRLKNVLLAVIAFVLLSLMACSDKNKNEDI